MNKIFQFNKWDPIVFEEHRKDNYLAVLENVRSKASKIKISDLAKDENQKAVKQAISVLNSNDFTIRQWRIAAYYLTGKLTNISNSEQFKTMILEELGR